MPQDRINQVAALRRWLSGVNFRTADLLQLEREIYEALAKAARKERWHPTPIAELAEPIDLDALVGDLINDAHEELRYQTGRLDFAYDSIAQTNNDIKARLETVEKLVTEASTAIQDITIVAGSENKDFLWISDSFNSPIYTDADRSSIQVDTDYGLASLSPQEFTAVEDFQLNLDFDNTVGLPGCNLLVLDITFGGSTEKEPVAFTEGLDTRSLANLIDGDPTTWFEIERNFIAPKQKLVLNGRAYRFSETGKEEDVKKVTKDLDWLTYVQWGEGGTVLQGAGDKGIPIAEFVDLGKEFSSPNGIFSNATQDFNARLTLEITLNTPQPLSILKLSPFVRERTSQGVQVESVRVLADGEWIDVAKDVEMGSNKATTRLQRDLLRRTGFQEVGSIYPIPTDRDIQKIRISLYARPEAAPQGMAHVFRDFLHFYRSERNHGLWRSVDKWREWRREPINKTPPTLVSLFQVKNRLTGSTSVPGLQSGAFVGQVTEKGQRARGLEAQDLIAGKQAASIISGGLKTLGGMARAATWLAKAIPVVGAALFLGSLVKGLFSYSNTDKVEDGRQGFDIFKGWRSAVGIRDLAVMRVRYRTEGTLYSVKRSFAKPVTRIGLFTDEHIPASWGPGDWLTYYISLDGTNWTPIPKLTDTTLERAFAPPEPITDVYFRCDFKGNPDDPFHSPQLTHYTLQGLPA